MFRTLLCVLNQRTACSEECVHECRNNQQNEIIQSEDNIWVWSGPYIREMQVLNSTDVFLFKGFVYLFAII